MHLLPVSRWQRRIPGGRKGRKRVTPEATDDNEVSMTSLEIALEAVKDKSLLNPDTDDRKRVAQLYNGRLASRFIEEEDTEPSLGVVTLMDEDPEYPGVWLQVTFIGLKDDEGQPLRDEMDLDALRARTRTLGG